MDLKCYKSIQQLYRTINFSGVILELDPHKIPPPEPIFTKLFG